MSRVGSTGAAGDLAGAASLRGRRVLVVGGGQQDYGQTDPPTGIGRAISVLCAREGAAVAVLDRDEGAARDTVARVRAEGRRAIAVTADASDPPALEAAIEAAETGLGGLDGLVLAVGIAGGQGLAGTDVAVWDLVNATNVRAPFVACRHALPRMARGAAVVFVSSTAPRRPGTNDMPAYLASKTALGGLCAHVAREGAPLGVRANVVMAGLVDTSLGRLATQVKPERADIAIPLGRQGSAWEVAQAAVYLLSDRASYVTAQTLVVDGGLTGAS